MGRSRNLLAIARLSIARGRAGICKSFAPETIAAELTRDEDEALLITADAGNSGSVNKFFSHALLALGIMGNGASSPMDRLAGYLLRSFPFRGHGPRKVPVVGEAQHLRPNLIECLRAIYDQGDEARNFDRNRAACGLVPVGNDRFLSRGGRSKRAAFEALLTRADEDGLPRPGIDELAELAALRFPSDAALRDELVAFGAKHGNFRQPDRAVDLARHFAVGGPITLEHLRQQFKSWGAGDDDSAQENSRCPKLRRRYHDHPDAERSRASGGGHVRNRQDALICGGGLQPVA